MTAPLTRLLPIALVVPLGVLAAALAVASPAGLPMAPVLVVGGLMLLTLGYRTPMFTLYLAIASAPLEVVTGDVAGVFEAPPSIVLLLASAAGWSLRRLQDRRSLFEASPVGVPLALLVLAIVPGLLISADPLAVAKNLVVWVALLANFQMVVSDGDSRTVRSILIALAFAGGAVGLIAVVNDFGGGQQVIDFGTLATGRAAGSFTHSSALGLFLAMAIPAQVALALRGPVWLRPLAIFGAVVGLLGITLSLSRAAFLGLAGGILVLLVWPSFRRAAAVVLAVLVAASLVGVPVGSALNGENVTRRITATGEAAGSSTDPRTQTYRAVPEIIADHPLFGVGAHNFAKVAPRYRLIDPHSGAAIGHAHSTPLAIATELGLVGFCALIWFVFALARSILSATRRTVGEQHAYALALAGAMSGVALHGIADNALPVNLISAVIFVLAACAVVIEREAPVPAEDRALGPKLRLPHLKAGRRVSIEP